MAGEEAPKPTTARSPVFFAAWGLAIYAGTHLASILLEATSMAAAVAQAVIAEWGAGRLGVNWTTPRGAGSADETSGAAVAKRAALGAAIGLLLAGATAAILVGTHAVVLEKASGAVSVVAVSLLTAGMYAMRDELVLHGVALRIFSASSGSGRIVQVVACGITSAGAAIGDGAAPRAVLVQALLGLVFGALWVRDGGAWPAWGAHTAFRFGMDVLFAGGFYDAQVAQGTWGGGSAGVLGGSAAVVALLPFGAAAVIWAARSPRAVDSPPGTAVG
jgi:hypothetical protein